MIDALWIGLLVWSTRSYDVRPQSILLIGLWVYSYLYVWVGGFYSAVPFVDLLALFMSVYMALTWTRKAWAWLIVAGHALYIVGFVVQWLLWQTSQVWYGDEYAQMTRIVFTLQCCICAIAAYKKRPGAWRHRGVNRT